MDTKRQCMALKASAGSGKTFALSVRFLALLFKGANPSEILTLTFTKKATAEMKERILDYLKILQKENLESGKEKSQNILKELEEKYHLDPSLVRNSAQKIYQRFLNAEIRISTIDAFFQSILRKFCWFVGLSTNFEVNEDTEAHQRQLNESFLSALNSEQLEELSAFIVQCLSYESYTSDSILERLRFLKNKLYLFDPNKKESAFDEEGFLEKLRSLNNQIQSIETASDRAKTAIKCDSFRGFLNSSLTWLKKKSEYQSFKKLESEIPTLERECEEIKNDLKRYYEAKETAIFKKFPKFIQLYDKATSKIQALDFDAIKDKVHVLLNGYEEMPAEFFYFRLDSKIVHILIDEFQDTSLNDYKILAPFIDEIKAGIGQAKWHRSVFFVGDVKQSIYAFRGSFSSLFESVSKDFYHDNLEFNHRSVPLIINYVNTIFKKAYQNSPTAYLEQKYPKTSQNKHVTEGYVKVSLVADEKELLLEQILQEAQNLLDHRIDPKDITILCATNKDALEIKNYLQERLSAIRPSTESSAKLSQLVESKIIKNALEYALAEEPYKPFYKHSVLKLAGYLHDDAIALPGFNPKKESVAGFVWKIMEQFKLYGEPAQSCLELAIGCEDANDFLEKLEAKSIASFNPKGVQIMTIHKSKGMQFPYVIVCERLGKPNSSHANQLLEEYNGAELVRLYYRMKNREVVDKDYARALDKEEAAKDHEEINVYYVAFTRAELGLIVVAKDKKESKKESKNKTMREQLDLASLEEGEITPVISPQKEPLMTSVVIKPHAYGEQVQEIEEEPDSDYEKNNNQEAINFGIALHKGLEYQYAYNIPKQSVLEYLNYHYGFYGLDYQALEESLELFENDAEIQALFKNHALKGEAAFLFQGVVSRIDVLLWDRGQNLYVLDYKSSQNYQQSHKAQVSHYAEFLRTQAPHFKIQAGIIYAHKRLLEKLWV
ncbi:RecB-like helicase [Helicobacter pylori]|uniref:DNA 3'-5' helicase n=1 Tax=Helicobacter pylori Hp H-24 TaxID=992039 RepID=J0KQQ6_HELPX|nr:RecB-like helicase [Helicobacter pylori]EJB52932.1 ATP-dependent DNA helicase [Helicobacter pylori Hp H-24]EJC19444.1 uvrD/REP helicase family protein [Helicobacter pylori Hp H-24b]EJC40313.1 ATP-dependent DNA helicase [Helicobacter pylori Hp M1]EJC42452.1 ATP-dependent DNA helicase [Helicobacter pylori Hp M2]EJC43672.1 ATP-dependent DNA helicase [Helicobacter pylori Hp M3]